jgi:nucleoside 2-deoxyribosyltransferase
LLLYLATPYSHPDLPVMQQRFDAACAAAAALMQRGYEVFSPIAHSHPLSDHMDEKLRTDFEFWMRQDKAILKHADALVVFGLPGWRQSRGVKAEIKYAHELGKPIYFIAGDVRMLNVLDQMIAEDAENYTEDNYTDFLDLEDAAGDSVVNAIREWQAAA